ncbi:MAG: T9SS type A sorting domain-containing protein, partial [bacterium]|nr:T9SS type A sorting domain-containing protein [bacterium]
DVNGDGTISILDLILVAQHLGESTPGAAPSIFAMDGREGLDPAMIQAWIGQAQIEDDGSVAFREGIAYLQSLLALLIPEETALLPNYPNPFNPETWIPYQLSEPAEVTLRIYSINGVLVRTLALGHTPAGIYQSRGRAAYWDGRNSLGESVASGLYFYTLTAGDFTATRKLLIRK